MRLSRCLSLLSQLTRTSCRHGVAGYYEKVAESYRNPHFPGLKKVLNAFMDRYVEQEKPTTIKVLDLAAGSGEATEVSPSALARGLS